MTSVKSYTYGKTLENHPPDKQKSKHNNVNPVTNTETSKEKQERDKTYKPYMSKIEEYILKFDKAYKEHVDGNYKPTKYDEHITTYSYEGHVVKYTDFTQSNKTVSTLKYLPTHRNTDDIINSYDN